MLQSGIVSVTFRQLSVEDILALAVRAGVAAIEWGGDIHVPHGDLAVAQKVRRLTSEAGLSIAAYGSYYRLGRSEAEGLPFERVLDTAAALGAPLVRVWAGDRGSLEADTAYRNQIAAESRRISDLAAQAGIAVGYEFHERTLTDTPESAVRLLREADHPALKTLWQPLEPDAWESRLEGLRQILPWLSHIHCYKCHDNIRLPLAEGEEEWMHYLQAVNATGRDCAVLLEFVRGDAPEAFLENAQTLKQWLERANLAAGR